MAQLLTLLFIHTKMAVKYYVGNVSTAESKASKKALIQRLDSSIATDNDYNTLDAVNRWLNDLFNKAGIPEQIWDYLRAQVFYETGYLTNSLTDENNLSSIRFINKPYQKNAYQSKVKGFAGFKTLQDWANDYKRILSLQMPKNKLGRPIDAKDSQQLYDRLLANGYFTEQESKQYANGWTQWIKRGGKMWQGYKSQYDAGVKAMETGGTTGVNWSLWNGIENKLQNLKNYAKANPLKSAAIGVGIAITIKFLSNGKKR